MIVDCEKRLVETEEIKAAALNEWTESESAVRDIEVRLATAREEETENRARVDTILSLEDRVKSELEDCVTKRDNRKRKLEALEISFEENSGTFSALKRQKIDFHDILRSCLQVKDMSELDELKTNAKKLLTTFSFSDK